MKMKEVHEGFLWSNEHVKLEDESFIDPGGGRYFLMQYDTASPSSIDTCVSEILGEFLGKLVQLTIEVIPPQQD